MKMFGTTSERSFIN